MKTVRQYPVVQQYTAQTMLTSLVGQMRRYARWKGRRDELITRGLALGIPQERIAAEMGIAKSVVWHVSRGHRTGCR